MPQPRNSLGNADIVRLEGVQCHAEGKGSKAERPHGSCTCRWYTLLGEVVDDTRPIMLLVSDAFAFNTKSRKRTETYSKPICEWMTSSAQKMESVTGFSDPAANGARVKGTMPAETIL